MYNAEHIRQYLSQYSQHVTHLAVGHTDFYTYGKSVSSIERATDRARQQFRHFRNSFNQFMYGAKAKRNNLAHGVLMLTTIEGTHKTDQTGLTIHFHIALGHMPELLTTDEIRQIYEHCWVDKAELSGRKIWLEEAKKVEQADNRWIYYTTKEATKGDEWVWDADNTQIPLALELAKRT